MMIINLNYNQFQRLECGINKNLFELFRTEWCVGETISISNTPVKQHMYLNYKF